MAGSEPGVLDLLQLSRVQAPRLLVIKASRAALLVYIGFIAGRITNGESEADRQRSRVESEASAILSQFRQQRLSIGNGGQDLSGRTASQSYDARLD